MYTRINIHPIPAVVFTRIETKFFFSIFSHVQMVKTVSSYVNRSKDVREVYMCTGCYNHWAQKLL